MLFRQIAASGLAVFHLKIGEGLITTEPLLVSTVLGSCVSVSFFHHPTKMSAIFHAMLPEQAMHRDGFKNPYKFVDSSIHKIVKTFDSHGVPRKELELKFFGGAYAMQQAKSGDVRTIVDVGAKNVEVARRILEEYDLAPHKENVLGNKGRKLYFNTTNGDIWLKIMGQSVLDQEKQAYAAIGAR